MSLLKGWIREGVARVIRVDKSTGAMDTVDHPHHEIHAGNAYMISQSKALNEFDIAAPMTWYVTTANTTEWMHVLIEADAAEIALLEVFEDDGNASHFNISGGSAVTPANRNRNSSNASAATVKSGVTVTQATSDVLIYSRQIGGKKEAGGASLRQEFILKQNTEYLFRFTSIADNNEGSFGLEWYEHIDKS